ncbi:GNAT family N-acetyltransferase [Timonella sp. A28]|uniref:GNAT family N-acetyltransferase n=1 Tax=Timonella sp. A28 TaxID=3442640 RepID=UPI003EB75E39
MSKPLEEHQQALAQLSAHAFADDPITSWIYESLSDRTQLLAQGFQFAFMEGISNDTALAAFIDDTVVGAALWHEHTHVDKKVIPDSPFTQRLQAVEEATNARHPMFNHLYVPVVAVHREHHRQGIGGTLISAILAVSDVQKKPVYLEASSHENRSFYQRYGFRNHGNPIIIEKHGPVLYPMLYS